MMTQDQELHERQTLKNINTHVSGVLRALGEPLSEVSDDDTPEKRALKTELREKQLRDREEFIKIYQPAILAYAHGVMAKYAPNHPSLSDYVAEVWSNIVDKFLQGKLKSFKHSGQSGAFRVWLRTVIRNECKRYLKKLNAGERMVSLAEDLETENLVGNDHTLEDTLRQTVIERAYQAMEADPLYGTPVLFAADCDGEFSSAELAEHLSTIDGATISVDAAKKRLERGRRLFAQKLIEQVAKIEDTSDLEQIEATLIELDLLGNCKRAMKEMRR